MKTKKLFLDFDDEEPLLVGTIQRKQEISTHELLFKINQLNNFQFFRKSDLEVEDFSGIHHFPLYEAYDKLSQTKLIIIANQSCHYIRKTPVGGLFDHIEEKFFLREDIDFIIFAPSGGDDFSHITLPSEWLTPIECISIAPEEELYPIIWNYDE